MTVCGLMGPRICVADRNKVTLFLAVVSNIDVKEEADAYKVIDARYFHFCCSDLR
jgi:hypothetical protein